MNRRRHRLEACRHAKREGLQPRKGSLRGQFDTGKGVLEGVRPDCLEVIGNGVHLLDKARLGVA